jgi:hypothetical protein
VGMLSVVVAVDAGVSLVVGVAVGDLVVVGGIVVRLVAVGVSEAVVEVSAEEPSLHPARPPMIVEPRAAKSLRREESCVIGL